MIIPLTTKVADDAESLRVSVPIAAGVRQPSDLLIDHPRAIDNRRLVRGLLAQLSADLIGQVGAAMSEVLDLVDD